VETSELSARKELIDSLELGDLVRINGTLRVVRDVSPGRFKQAQVRVRSITFSILRCSWTRRPYTVKNRCDLYHAKVEVVQKGFGCEHGPIEVVLQEDITKRFYDKSLLECCDVIGVIT
jgi:hypothetical protein